MRRQCPRMNVTDTASTDQANLHASSLDLTTASYLM
jgi:hypothetical protein